MSVQIEKYENEHRFFLEMRRTADLTGVPLSSQDVTDDLLDLVEETFVTGLLSGMLPEIIDSVEVRIEPYYQQLPLVSKINVHLRARSEGVIAEFSQDFKTGRWSRTATRRLLQLREEGTLAKSETAYPIFVALPVSGSPGFDFPALQTPPIVDGTVEDVGCRELGPGKLDPYRPVLVNQRFLTDTSDACVGAGVNETGGATLGMIMRLPQPLPGTSTRIVTILTMWVPDQRHTGQLNQWTINPEALLEAAKFAELRGMGESVITVTHTHGFNTECGNCNSNADCPLAECSHVSLMDYQVLETLFPGKSALMPIAGRRLGTAGNRPVLEIHAWRGGKLRPIRWQHYLD